MVVFEISELNYSMFVVAPYEEGVCIALEYNPEALSALFHVPLYLFHHKLAN
jgi:hypothetical protein